MQVGLGAEAVEAESPKRRCVPEIPYRQLKPPRRRLAARSEKPSQGVAPEQHINSSIDPSMVQLVVRVPTSFKVRERRVRCGHDQCSWTDRSELKSFG
jgi:hypothetical protein